MNFSIFDQQNNKVVNIEADLWQKNIEQSKFLQQIKALPILEDDTSLHIAIDNVSNLAVLDKFSFLTTKKVIPVIVAKAELIVLLNSLNKGQNFSKNADFGDFQQEEKKATTPKTTKKDALFFMLDSLFQLCLQKNVSDIHLEPQQNNLRIRLRIDGVLHLYQNFTKTFALRIISRLKLLAKLDISEMRRPQDGQFHFKTELGQIIDLRLSTLPTLFGEKLVLRIQKNQPVHNTFIELGFTEEQERMMQKTLAQPQGLILVTGPTGSGKSITLYTALSQLNSIEKNIITAEDPIEIELEGIIQTQVNTGLDIDFATLLRTFLRQDPDIIMLGEIRDEISAQIALRASQTGHLVLATLHTNDAPSAVARLKQLGLQDFEINSSLLLVVAQRLVRKLCNLCVGKGCRSCFNGYLGRVGVYQLLSKTGEIFDMQTANLDYESLALSAKEKVAQQITDLKEVKRVFGV